MADEVLTHILHLMMNYCYSTLMCLNLTTQLHQTLLLPSFFLKQAMTPSLWQSFLSVITFHPLQPFCYVFFPVGASKMHDLRMSVSCQEHLHAQYQTNYLSRFFISLVSEPDHMTVSSYYFSFLIFPIPVSYTHLRAHET